MRCIGVILAVALVGAYFIGWAAADGNESNSTNAYILSPEDREKLIDFVNESGDFVQDVGQDKALEVFNDPSGKFVRGELYIIAYDFNGTCLANPFDPEIVGQNVLNMTDINGVAFKRNMLDVARRGSGFTFYVWPNPAHSNADELKLTYVLKVNDGLWLGAGAYMPGQVPVFTDESREDLVAFVESARDFALNTTKEKAIETFNDKNERFVEGNRYIFAEDFAGNTLALPNQPDLVGKNRINEKDPNGVEYIRDSVDLAHSGGGFIYYLKPDPARNMALGLKLSYILKVNDTWYLGSGIYAT